MDFVFKACFHGAGAKFVRAGLCDSRAFVVAASSFSPVVLLLLDLWSRTRRTFWGTTKVCSWWRSSGIGAIILPFGQLVLIGLSTQELLRIERSIIYIREHGCRITPLCNDKRQGCSTQQTSCPTTVLDIARKATTKTFLV